MAAVFLAQATNTDLTFAQELGLIGILLLTSKGAAGVTGSGLHRAGGHPGLAGHRAGGVR